MKTEIAEVAKTIHDSYYRHQPKGGQDFHDWFWIVAEELSITTESKISFDSSEIPDTFTQ